MSVVCHRVAVASAAPGRVGHASPARRLPRPGLFCVCPAANFDGDYLSGVARLSIGVQQQPTSPSPFGFLPQHYLLFKLNMKRFPPLVCLHF